MTRIEPRMDGTELERAHFRIKALRSALWDIQATDTKAAPDFAPKHANNALLIDDGRAGYTEETCPAHVASEHDRKVCARCGTHIDSLRPLEPDNQ